MIIWPVTVKQNKYTKWYEQLVQSAVNRSLPKTTYTEKHHIIPKSMGGSDTAANLVDFTAREHYIAHLLLWQMTMAPKWHNKMTMALHMMVNGSGYGKQKLERSKYLMPSRLVEKYRLEWREHLSESMKGENNPFYGKTHSEETKELLRQRNAENKHIRSEKLKGENNGMYGKQHTEETKQYLSKTSKGWWTDDLKQEQSERVKNQWQDNEYRKTQSQSRRARWSNLSEEQRSAIGQKAAATKKANGNSKLSEETKKKLSESRKKSFAEGKIVPWNKGKKVGCFKSQEVCRQSAVKAAQTRKLNGTTPNFKGENNPFFGKTHSEETKAKIRATKAAKKLTNLPNKFESLFDIIDNEKNG
jgi:hypothetical protein